MRFVWDARKGRVNRAKHRISFENAVLVFDDPFALSVQDRIEDGEERWQTIGMIESTVVIVVAHTAYEENEEEVIRIISARKATPRERRVYAAQAAAFE